MITYDINFIYKTKDTLKLEDLNNDLKNYLNNIVKDILNPVYNISPNFNTEYKHNKNKHNYKKPDYHKKYAKNK